MYYPVREKHVRDGNAGTFVPPYFGLGVGWFAYAVKGYSPRAISLFKPFDSFYGRHWLQCCISLALNAAFAWFCLVPYAQYFGFAR